MVTLDYKLMLSLSLWQYNHHPDEGLTSGLFQKTFGPVDGKHYYEKWTGYFNRNLWDMIAYFRGEGENGQKFCDMIAAQVELYTKNRDKREGMRLIEAHEELSRLFPWSQFPNYKDKHIVFSVRDFKLTSDGKLLDVSVYNIYTKPDTLLAENKQRSLILALKETLKSIYPWEVICYNGKYVMHPESETLSIVRDKE